jgi:hypothetical protein
MVVRWACEKIKNSKKIAVNREEDWIFYRPDLNDRIEEFYQKCVNNPYKNGHSIQEDIVTGFDFVTNGSKELIKIDLHVPDYLKYNISSQAERAKYLLCGPDNSCFR